MPKNAFLIWLLFIIAGSLPVSSQQLALSTGAKTCSSGEPVWVNLSVLDAMTMPGAYKIGITYNGDQLTFVNTLPAETGPFSITPATSVTDGKITVAGFQGIVDTGSGNSSLITLVFKTATNGVVIDTATFSVTDKDVFSTGAQPMDLRVTRQATSVLLPASDRQQTQPVFLSSNYLRFALPRDGITSVRIFDLNGRVLATPLAPTRLKAGNHGIPLGHRLRSGIYIVAIRGVGLSATRKLEVVK